jgi:CheY-like chemotaxis protein
VKNILVVEDDPGIRESLADLLRFEQYAVSAASHGKEALLYLQQPAVILPHLILIDLKMPVMGGLQFLVERKAYPKIAKIPVIVLSGNNDMLDRGVALKKMCVVDCLEKPINIEKLLETIQAILA